MGKRSAGRVTCYNAGKQMVMAFNFPGASVSGYMVMIMEREGWVSC